MRSIGVSNDYAAKVGVATLSGKAYYKITSLLNRAGFSYTDLISGENPSFPLNGDLPESMADRYIQFSVNGGNGKDQWKVARKPDLIITTQKERLLFRAGYTMCIEDLGDDVALAREKILGVLYPDSFGKTGTLVVGVDPGKRTGLAAFINNVQVESRVLGSIEDTVSRIEQLLMNAPDGTRRIVKIGFGNREIATRIAREIGTRFGKNAVRIELVDEKGTSSLSVRRNKAPNKRKRRMLESFNSSLYTRDERSARLIAFRKGAEFSLAA